MAELTDYRARMARLLAALKDIGAMAGEAATPAEVAAVGKAAADAGQEAKKAYDAAMASRIDLGPVVIAFRSVVSVQLGVLVMTLPVAGAKVGDRVYVHQTSVWPAGYAILGNGYVPAAGSVQIRLLTPLIALNAVGDVSLPAYLIGFRKAD